MEIIIGLEVGVELYQPRYKLREICNEKDTVYENVKYFYLSVFNFGYRNNIDITGWSGSFSLLHWGVNKVNFNVVKFNYLKRESQGSFSYSPEIGLQLDRFQVKVGYNLIFKKSMRDYERFYISVNYRISI